MKKIIHPIQKIISVIVPPSKSIAIRGIAIAMATLKYNPNINKFTINNFPNCDDTIVAISIAKELGFDIDSTIPNSISLMLDSSAITSNDTILLDCKESALCYRLFSSFAKLFATEIKLLTNGRLAERVKGDFIENLYSGEYEIDCSSTSQLLTGLLYSLPFMEGDSVIKINNLVSKGYIDLGIKLLQDSGINIDYENDIIKIKGNQKINKDSLCIDGDWSIAANYFVLGAISSEILIANVDADSNQPDAMILKLFKDLKINISQVAQNIFKVNKSKYDGFEFDITDCPDLAPALVVLAFNANTSSKIIGINRLVNKECNRRDVLVKVFSMMGGKIRIVGNSFVLQPSKLTGGFADSHNDHRIAMAIAVASKICTNPITLTGAESVNKSFPDFWKYFD